MHQQLKKYGSLFLLLLFLFPIVEKQLHAFDHINDKHCVATDKHFHELEHSCSICEFTIADTCPVPDIQLDIVVSEYTYSFQSFIQSLHVPEAFQDLPSRAPPIC
jgi:hypothetical protein